MSDNTNKEILYQESIDNIDSLLNSINDLYHLEQHETASAASISTVVHSSSVQDSSDQTAPADAFSPESLENLGFNEPQIAEITLGQTAGIDISPYAKTHYSWKQMREIRHGLLLGLNTSVYENELYSPEQMHELRMGLINHVNASLYANLMLSATDMRKIRLELSEAAYHNRPYGYAASFTDEDSGLIIRISDDCMNAYIMLPSDIADRFSVNRLSKILKKHEITHGIITEELERFSRDLPHDVEIRIAQGTRPEKGSDGYYEYFFNKEINDAPDILEDGTVDYSKVKVTETVKANQILAIYHPAKTGQLGSTISGITIKEGGGQDLPAITGEGFSHSDHVYKALYTGNITFQEDTYLLNVWKNYTIEGDATRYSGSTEYDGTVLVKGDVRNMAHIKATGDIIINGMVEGANLYSGHNIIIRGGVNAAGKGSIEAEGKITGSFFESANLRAGGPIEGNYFLSCHIITDDKVLAKGGKALIQGGDIIAALGVETHHYRSYGGSKTKVEVGRTTELLTRKQEIAKQLTTVTDEIRRLRDGKFKLLQLFGSDRAPTYPIYQRTCEALEQKENAQDILDLKNERLENILQSTLRAYIKIGGIMQSGIHITICGYKKILETQLRHVTLTAESLTKEEEKNEP